MAKKQTLSVAPDEILVAEFNYIVQTAIQANEDRARVTSFYMVSVGSFIAGLITAQIEALQVQIVFLAFGGLFLLLFIAGILTLKQLIRLRLAWLESIAALNQIKEYYAAANYQLDSAFRWSNKNAPPGYSPGSVSHLLAIQVSLLSAIMLFVAVLFIQFGFAVPAPENILASGASLAFGLVAMLQYYRLILVKNSSS
ncbi:MAG: hypothetical protein HYZ26_02930 [Chloroflexi bacterium]|nr:hypothetical protein [Chloroflexota bacterium]